MEEIPKDRCEDCIVPIYKKGKQTQCENYRAISLLNIVYKILAKIIDNGLRKVANGVVGDYQYGFRNNRPTIDQIFSLKQIATRKMLEEKHTNTYDIHRL